MSRTTVATIHLGALRHNLARLKVLAAPSQVMAVVKADAYGHGAVDVAGAALGAGASALCVSTIPEGLALRAEYRTERIVVLGPAGSNREVAQARDAGLELAISDAEIPEGVRVHLKLETGMGRYGLAELPSPATEVVGLMTHLATADSDAEFARAQIERFRVATEQYSHLTRHVANSAGALRLPESHFDAARCGVAIYGLSPFNTDPAEDGLEPVLSWHTSLAQLKLLQPGQSTGYGRRFVAERDTWVGTIPIGYGDGFRRGLTNRFEAVVGGRRVKGIGTVSMDNVTVDLGDRPVPRGTEAVLIGDGILAEDLAKALGTINYEVTCGISARVPRRYE